MYARTFRNVMSDMMTRAKLTEIQQWAKTGKFEWQGHGQAWADFSSVMLLGEDRYVTVLKPEGQLGRGFPTGWWLGGIRHHLLFASDR